MLLALFVCASTAVYTASAYSIGENIEFDAGEIESTGGGNTNSYQRTEQERQLDFANYTTNSKITDMVRDYINSLSKDTQHSEQTGTGYVFVIESDTPTKILSQITEKKDDYKPGGYYYSVYNGYTGPTETNLTADQYAALAEAAAKQGWDTTYTNPDSDGDLKLKPGEGLPKPDLVYFEHYIKDNGVSVRANPVPGNGDIIDSANHPGRHDIIDTYLSFFSAKDTVKTAYIIEFKAESIVESALWESKALTWHQTGKSHYWQFECIESFDGNAPPPFDLFGGKSISQPFYFPGKYHVTATQILEESYYDTMTYSINEYWILEETGMVIWKSESTGRRIKDEANPLSELGTRLITNYNHVHSGTYYVPVYDATIEVRNSSWTSSFTAPDIFGYDFTTKRRK